MRRTSIAITAILCSAAQAQTLVPGALICETEAPLSVVAEERMVGRSGAEIVQHIAKVSKAFDLAAQFSAVSGALAQREQAIYRDSRTPDRGATSSRIRQAEADPLAAAGARYAEFNRRCASLPEAQSATVIERRPISGTARVRTDFQGAQSEFWTFAYFIRE